MTFALYPITVSVNRFTKSLVVDHVRLLAVKPALERNEFEDEAAKRSFSVCLAFCFADDSVLCDDKEEPAIAKLPSVFSSNLGPVVLTIRTPA
jgi:hypothetical protein